jgi:hypothetical protein
VTLRRAGSAPLAPSIRGRASSAALLLSFTACSAAAPRPAVHPDPGTLHAPGEYPGSFLDRQTIAATYAGRSAKFDAVLQKQGNDLLLLGMTPFGSRAFALKQSGLEVSYESFIPQVDQLPFPPRYILLDVHRVFFGGIPTDGQPLADGPHEAPPRDGELLTEYWQDRRLKQRRYRSTTVPSAGEIVIDYDSGMQPGGPPPPHIAFVNGWFGYRLDITTVSHQPL